GVHSILLDRLGRLWVGSVGLICLDPETQPIRFIRYFDRVYSPVIGQRAFALSERNDGGLWVAGYGLALVRMDSSGNTRLSTFERSQDLGREILSAFETDQAGNLWVAVGHVGLARISPERFVRYSEADGLKGRNVAGLAESRQGTLTAINRNQYAWNLFDGSGFHSMIPRLPPSVTDMAWGVGQIVHQDRQGGWWVASGQGLLHYGPADTPEKLSGTPPIERITQRNGLPAPPVVLQIFEDSGGAIWAGLLDGIARRDPATGQWQNWDHAALAASPSALAPVPAESFAEDRSGGVWAGLGRAGLVRFRNGGVQRFTRIVPDIINQLFADTNGR